MKDNISQAVINELLRIICFVVYYITLITLGVALFVGAIWASFHIVVDIIPVVGNVRTMILLLMAVVGILLMAVMIGIYLIKPVFYMRRLTKNILNMTLFSKDILLKRFKFPFGLTVQT